MPRLGGVEAGILAFPPYRSGRRFQRDTLAEPAGTIKLATKLDREVIIEWHEMQDTGEARIRSWRVSDEPAAAESAAAAMPLLARADMVPSVGTIPAADVHPARDGASSFQQVRHLKESA